MNAQAAAEAYRNDADFAATANQKMQELLSRSATDAGFRAKLIAEPRAAIAEFIGRDAADVGELPNMRFVENKADATIVLPEFVDPDAELSEQELEAVAGGSEITFGVIVIISMLSAAYMSGRSAGRENHPTN